MSDEYTTCEDCELETLGPDDHKCPNPECPSHDKARAEVLAFDRPRPLVTIGHPRIPVVVVGGGYPDPDDRTVEVPEALVLTCSEHGELTGWRSIPERAHLRYLARAHAIAVHDEQVDAKGWYW